VVFEGGGNPIDSDRFIPILDQHIAHYGRAPRQMAAMPASTTSYISKKTRKDENKIREIEVGSQSGSVKLNIFSIGGPIPDVELLGFFYSGA